MEISWNDVKAMWDVMTICDDYEQIQWKYFEMAWNCCEIL